jgi:hypothetical protein
LTLDEALQGTIPPLLALLDALPADSLFLTLDLSQRRQRTLVALKRLSLRQSQVQPLLLVYYRPEYQHGWGSKTYYTQFQLDPLPPANADELLQALVGDDPSFAPLTQLLIARTEGNPFFLEEGVGMLVETGALVGDWVPLASRSPSTARRCPPPCRQSWPHASTGSHPRKSNCCKWQPSSARRCLSPCSRCWRTSVKRHSTSIARTQFGQILERVSRNRERFLMPPKGEAKAAILGIEDFLQAVVKSSKSLAVLQEQAKKSGTDTLTIEEIEAEITAVRRAKPRPKA